MDTSLDPDHPRPTLQRPGWAEVGGTWSCHLDRDAAFEQPDEVPWDQTITVPFAPETDASGIGATGFIRRMWYRQQVETEAPGSDERILVQFGAVDRIATVWADGCFVGHHVGGSTPFAVDLTGIARAAAVATTSATAGATAAATISIDLIVRADDDPHDLTVPRGKQDWEAEPHEIFYPRTTGIWQRVWLERVPACHVADVAWRTEATTAYLDVVVNGPAPPDSWLEISLHHWPADVDEPSEMAIARERVALQPGREVQTIRRAFELATDNPEVADHLCWWPHQPNLLGWSMGIVGPTGAVIDATAGYTGLRTVVVHDGRITINGFALPLRFALDQGYWPTSGMTAPDAGALRRDVESVLSLGLNGVRKHQKIEDPRFLYWADRLGLLVWEELPSAFRHGDDTVAALTQEWAAVIRRDRNHPSVIAWVPINESWGVPLAARTEHRDHARHRATIEALVSLTRAMDPTRLVSANDGWETIDGDLVGVHDYANDVAAFTRRYETAEAIDKTLRERRPGGRRITLDGSGTEGRAVILSEFGGLTLAPDAGDLFGYGNATSVDELLDRYGGLCRALAGCHGLAGWCWTQLTDTYQEANGLLHMDRTPKAPIEQLREATLGMRGVARGGD